MQNPVQYNSPNQHQQSTGLPDPNIPFIEQIYMHPIPSMILRKLKNTPKQTQPHFYSISNIAYLQLINDAARLNYIRSAYAGIINRPAPTHTTNTQKQLEHAEQLANPTRTYTNKHTNTNTGINNKGLSTYLTALSFSPFIDTRTPEDIQLSREHGLECWFGMVTEKSIQRNLTLSPTTILVFALLAYHHSIQRYNYRISQTTFQERVWPAHPLHSQTIYSMAGATIEAIGLQKLTPTLTIPHLEWETKYRDRSTQFEFSF